jgi:Helix-hairpin-helix domain
LFISFTLIRSSFPPGNQYQGLVRTCQLSLVTRFEISGVGSGYAKKLVRALGEKECDVIEATPDRPREVDGIGPVRAASILFAPGLGLYKV